MISLYSGTPGSGKSLHIASRIYYTLKRDRPVVANFEINKEKIRKGGKVPFLYLDNMRMNPQALIDFYRFIFKGRRVKEDYILLVIDECQLLFNSREWQRSGRQEWLSFFSQHRKYGYEIVLIAQFDGMVDKQIRTLIEYEYKHRKVSNFGIIGKVFSIFALGKMFCSVKIWYPLNERIDSEFFMARKKFYTIYDSYVFFDDPNLTTKKEGSAIELPS